MATSLVYSASASDVDFFLTSLDAFLQIAALFNDCDQSEKENLLERAEQTLSDVIILNPFSHRVQAL